MNKTSTTKKIKNPRNTQMNNELDNTNDFPYEPGNNVIDNILNYSKALTIRESKDLEYFEMVLN
jgi:hypothetical protein